MTNSLYNFEDGILSKYISSLIDKELEGEKSKFQLAIVKGEAPEQGKYIINPDGIFNIINGYPKRRYLYLEKYNVDRYRYPKYHLFFCETVAQYRNFKFSNAERVDIINKSNNAVHSDKKLELCKNCRRIFKNKTSKRVRGQSFMELVLTLEANKEINSSDIGADGYLYNWDEISTAYRSIKNYTCENCQFKASRDDYFYMETHHVNYDRTDNKVENLKCLCVLCHANVDDRHRENFSKPKPKRKVNLFIIKNKRKLQKCKNPYLKK